ncbi:hypothetical protein C9374_008572 [Naegleria lovaniensis]|uniref:Protein kinase domain-containing protein n=1 Tax=Naegleria lovaniensis TaxID=51637 RepID=A0AA88KFN5_NAELO|nr:uncharacterized protein C9374_008572 [Naegleria lovaniensis]KAG2377950.1 hypothetical protein C9374_008572 [Naegleria lovaniensis]
MGNSANRPASLAAKIATSTSNDYNAAKCIMADEEYDDETVEPGQMIDCKDQLLKSGSIIESYRVDKLIGKGTYSQVYKCEKKVHNTSQGSTCSTTSTTTTLVTEKTFSIKCCYARNDADWRLIISEVAAMKNLQHDNILKFYEYFEISKEVHTSEDPMVAIVMEYCNNGSIGDFIKRNRHITADLLQMLDWVVQSIHGIGYCHKMNVVHRDIKPHNILLHAPHENGRIMVKLCDFGLSSLVKDKTETLKTFCGSPIYAAPEINRLSYSFSVDVYSLGVTALEMLCRLDSCEFQNRIYNKSRDCTCLEKLISELPLKSLQKLIKLMTSYDEKERITSEDLIKHPTVKAFEAVISISRGILNATYFEMADREFIETIFELLDFYKEDIPKIEILFQAIVQLFQLKPDKCLEVVQSQMSQIGSEFLFIEGVSLESKSSIFFILISIGSWLCSYLENLNNKSHCSHNNSSSQLTKRSRSTTLYNVFSAISEHSPGNDDEDDELKRNVLLLINNIKHFILEFANYAGENYQITILSYLVQSLMMDTANRSPPPPPMNTSPQSNGSKSSLGSLFTIDDKSFVFLMIREMVIQFDICKQAVILKNKPQLSPPTTSELTCDQYSANRMYSGSFEPPPSLANSCSSDDLSRDSSAELREAFLRAVHQRLLSSQCW